MAWPAASSERHGARYATILERALWLLCRDGRRAGAAPCVPRLLARRIGERGHESLRSSPSSGPPPIISQPILDRRPEVAGCSGDSLIWRRRCARAGQTAHAAFDRLDHAERRQRQAEHDPPVRDGERRGAEHGLKGLFRVRGGQGLRAKPLFAKREGCATRNSMHRSSASPLLGV